MAHGCTWSTGSRRRARIPTCATAYGPAGYPTGCAPSNQYNPQLTKAGLQSFPRPSCGATRRADGAGRHEQPVLQHRSATSRGHGGRAPGRPARDLHHQGKPDLRPGSGRPGSRQRRSQPGRVRAGDHAESAQPGAKTSSRSTTSSTPPKSAMTAGRGPRRRARPTWSSANSRGLRGTRPQPGFRGHESQCERCAFRPSPSGGRATAIPDGAIDPTSDRSVAGPDRRGCAGRTEQ